MNIQQYYRSAANAALNGSLAAFVPVILILSGGILFSVKLPLFTIILPFCLCSLFYYQIYLLQAKRSLESVIKDYPSETDLENAQNILITFMPAPTLRMLLFEPKGHLIGEVRDMRFWWWRWFLPYFADHLFPKVYGFYNQENQLQAIYKVNNRKKYIKIFDAELKEMGIYTDHSGTAIKKRGNIHSFSNSKDILVEGSVIYPNLKFRDEQDYIISKLIKGWMPAEWGKRFRDANTPYIILDETLEKFDKILILGVLADYYKSTSH